MPSKRELDDDRLWQAELHRWWRIIEQLDDIGREPLGNSIEVREIRLQSPQHTGTSWRAIIKGQVAGRKFVAFHTGETARDVITGAVNKIRGDNPGWKDDLPYDPSK